MVGVVTSVCVLSLTLVLRGMMLDIGLKQEVTMFTQSLFRGYSASSCGGSAGIMCSAWLRDVGQHNLDKTQPDDADTHWRLEEDS